MMPWCMKKSPTIQTKPPILKAALLQAVSNDNAEEVGFMKLPPWGTSLDHFLAQLILR